MVQEGMCINKSNCLFMPLKRDLILQRQALLTRLPPLLSHCSFLFSNISSTRLFFYKSCVAILLMPRILFP